MSLRAVKLALQMQQLCRLLLSLTLLANAADDASVVVRCLRRTGCALVSKVVDDEEFDVAVSVDNLTEDAVPIDDRNRLSMGADSRFCCASLKTKGKEA